MEQGEAKEVWERGLCNALIVISDRGSSIDNTPLSDASNERWHLCYFKL